jgi:septal ring factor EnvC (AmiA/AmiB activator)
VRASACWPRASTSLALNPVQHNRRSRWRHRQAAGAGALAVLVGGLGLVAGSAPAQDAAALERRIASARAEAETIGADLDARTSRLAAVRDRAGAAAEREGALTALLAEGREREAGLRDDAEAAARRLGHARGRLRRAIGALADRLIAIYMGGQLDATALLLEADGFDDLATRSEYLRRIEESDSRLAARVRELRDAVRVELEALREARAEATAHNSRIEAARSRIASVRSRSEAEAAALRRAQVSQAQALSSLRSNLAGWTEQVRIQGQLTGPEAQDEVISWFGDWAIPQAIVICESGGNYQALNPSSGAGGAYQILPSTWKAYGGKGLPHEASKAEQDRIAALIWRDSGSGAWVCAR